MLRAVRGIRLCLYMRQRVQGMRPGALMGPRSDGMRRVRFKMKGDEWHMVRLLVLAVIVILVVIAFHLGRRSEHGRLIDLEPDKAESEKWSAKTAQDSPKGATAGAAPGATSGTAASHARKSDDDVIDVEPEDIEEL